MPEAPNNIPNAESSQPSPDVISDIVAQTQSRMTGVPAESKSEASGSNPPPNDPQPKPEGANEQESEPMVQVPTDILNAIAPQEKDDMPPETHEADSINPEDVKDEKTRKALIHYRTELKSLQEKIQSGQQVQPEQLTSLQEENKTLKQRLEEMDGLVQKAALEHSPSFREKHDNQIDFAIDQMKGMVQQFGLDEELATKLSTASLKDAMQIINEEAPEYASMLTSSLTHIHNLRAQRQRELDNWKETAPQIQQQEQQQFQEQVMTAKTEHFQKALKSCVNENQILLKPVQGDPNNPQVSQWNKMVAGLHENAMRLFLTQDVGEQAKAMVASVQVPVLMQMWTQAQKTIQKYQEALNKHAIDVPGISEVVTPTSGQPGETKPASSSPEDVAAAIAAKAQSQGAG